MCGPFVPVEIQVEQAGRLPESRKLFWQNSLPKSESRRELKSKSARAALLRGRQVLKSPVCVSSGLPGHGSDVKARLDGPQKALRRHAKPRPTVSASPGYLRDLNIDSQIAMLALITPEGFII